MATLIHYGVPVEGFLRFSPLLYDFLSSARLTSTCGSTARSDFDSPASSEATEKHSELQQGDSKPEETQKAPLTETSGLPAEATSSQPTPSDVHPERERVQVSLERLARYDAHETKSAYVFQVELPGVDANNIKLQVEKRVLDIEGTREDSTDTVDAKIVFT
eukprot:CAMPEP_0184646388 /NCGR_PEP_ID=MMETSP0308-20130426/3089_1 /TAXON_ID=38269 /ORGANISM="Gloeochaete witrockiana, Strain SAG 46.84" /LENGTH=161 /DNA_ID=CAMNT_0027076365 /DNA_START=223 /DNA_END=705 /DNA_ORIENTATION=-